MPTHGRFQIKRISTEDATPATYQISYEPFQGGEFTGSVEAEHLHEFLRHRLELSEDSVQALEDELQSRGHVLIPEVELSESVLAAAGLEYLSAA